MGEGAMKKKGFLPIDIFILKVYLWVSIIGVVVS